MNAEAGQTGEGRQIVTVQIGDVTFGLPISLIEGIVPWEPLTHVPRMPAFVGGIVTVRGSVLAVADLRIRLGLEPAQWTPANRIVIVQVDGLRIGCLVDLVREVVWAPASSIETKVPLVAEIGEEFLDGVARLEGGLVLLLRADRLLGTRDRQDIAGIQQRAA